MWELEAELEAISCDGLDGALDATLEVAGVPAGSTVRSLAKRMVGEWLEPCLHAVASA